MKNKKIYIILFIILYVFVALVSGIHGFAFFSLANTPLLAIMLAIAFEIGQAAVLFSILTDENQQKKTMPWVLMVILTLVQVMGNVYNSYKYLISNSEVNLRFFKEPIFIWTQLPDAQANVILSYIQGAILPIVALLLTSMVTGFLNKKPTEEINKEEKQEPLKEENNEKLTEPKITINKETGEITTPTFGPHKDIYIPLPEEENKKIITKEEFPVKEEPKKEIILEADTPSEEALKKFEEIKKEREKIEENEIPQEVEEQVEEKTNEKEIPQEIIEEIQETDSETENEDKEENPSEFAHEIINNENTKKASHFINI